MDEQQAAEALAAVRVHQDRTRRAARLPWWVYAAVFVLAAGGMALNDVISLSSAKLVAVLVLVVVAVVFVTSRVNGPAPLGRVRGVQRRQSFVPWVFGVVAFLAGLGAWLISRYGSEVTHDLADAVGLPGYPNTVGGVLYGAVFTALFALSQLLLAVAQRRQSA
jgi:Mn2+/Fe2+ NRAMP family transporter